MDEYLHFFTIPPHDIIYRGVDHNIARRRSRRFVALVADSAPLKRLCVVEKRGFLTSIVLVLIHKFEG